MANVRKSVTPAGVRWLVKWREPDGKHRTRAYPTEREANQERARVEQSIGEGSYVSPAGGRERFGVLAERWMIARRVAASTRARDRVYLDQYVLPAFAGVQVGRITPADVERWVVGLHDRGLASATVSRSLRYVRSILDIAVRDRLVMTNPAARSMLQLPRLDTVRPRDSMTVLTSAQVADLVDAVNPYYRPLVSVAVATGLRWGEVVGLPVSAVDFLRGELHVRQQLTEVAGYLEVSERLKTASSRRTVTVGAPVLDVIAHHVGRYPNDAGLVFTGPEGGMLRRSAVGRRILKPAAASIGVEGLRFHDLRHTHASLLLAAGHPVTEVAARLGHAHPGITLQTYAHAIPGNERAAADAMDALLAGAFESARRFGGTAAVQAPSASVLPFSR